MKFNFKKNKLRKLLSKAYWVLMAFVLLASLFTLFSSYTLPGKGFPKWLVVYSGSMSPAIRTGSLVLTQQKPEYKTGDVISYITEKELGKRNPKNIVSHRIVEVKDVHGKNEFITKGDANNTTDSTPVKQGLVLGKVLFSLPLLGYLVGFAKTLPGLIILIVIPATIIVYSEVSNLRKAFIGFIEKKKHKKEKGDNKLFQKTLILLLFVSLLNIPATSGYYKAVAASINNSFSTGDWIAPPIPDLISPVNNSYVNTAGLVMDWSDVADDISNPAYYIYQSAYDAPFSLIAYTSGNLSNSHIPAPGTPDGVYWWRVKACDAIDNCSVWSEIWKVTVDSTAPSSASLSITGSFTKSVAEKITNGDFESGLTGWTTAGDVAVLSTDTINDASPSSAVIVTPVSGSNMAVIGNVTYSVAEDDATTGNYVWENRLMGSFDSGAKSLSLQYNFFTRDFSPFDDPGFFIRLNGQEIFKLNTLSVNPTKEDDGLAYNTGWSEFYYDLSNHNDSKVNLSIYGGNTGDQDYQSWVYIDKITTYFVSAPDHAVYTLSGDDDPGGSGINRYEYDIDGAGWLPGNTFGGVPSLSNGGTHTVQYRSVDNAGNSSPVYTVKIITDTVAPADIADFRVDAVPDITENSILLTWTASGNDGLSGRASQYDLRYSISPIINDLTFEAATKVDKVPSPKNSGEEETLEVIGLNPLTTYYFAIKAADEAPNWSGIATVSATTLPSSYTVNAGDIVINELMWMGSSASDVDEWLELRNMTDRDIDLTGWQLTSLVGESNTETLMLTIPSGKTIPAHGYFLISNLNKVNSAINVEPDLVDSSVVLKNTDLQIQLYDGDWLNIDSQLIDTAWDGTAPAEGFYDSTAGLEKYYSMERTSVPEDGSNPLNWYTGIDAASTLEFFDGGADERGTPGAANRSENEPLANQPFILRITPTPETSPTPTPTPIQSGPTAEPLLTPEPFYSPEPIEVPEPTPSSEPMSSAEPTPEATQTPAPTPEETNEPTPAPELEGESV